MSRDDLSLREARRIALAAQGFDQPRPKRPASGRQLARLIRQLGLLQLDYVNVLVPAHYQVPFSRLGPYDRSRLDALVYRGREFTEQWAREASIVPMETWPLLRHRMEVHSSGRGGFDELIARNPKYVARILDQIRERGPLKPDDIPEPKGAPGPAGGWTAAKAAMEHHFGRGALAIADRLPNFARVYDLAERVVPREHFSRRLDRDEAQRELLRVAARAQGVGTLDDLADDYRMPIPQARPRIAELVEAGQLREVRVEGWDEPAFLHPKAKLPKRIDVETLLSPFDPVLRHRERAARLFDFDYRIEIFVTGSKRKWGYYVLPFLLGDRLVARVDLKSDRAAGRLLVLASYLESGHAPRTVAGALATELHTMAAWLGLDSVHVAPKGDFAQTLAAAV